MGAALLASGVVTVESVACTGWSPAPEQAVPGVESGPLRNTVSMRVIARVDD